MVANSILTKIKKTGPASFQLSASPAKIIEAYKNGGNPTLDGGNSLSLDKSSDGMDVVDKIAEVETDDKDKPKEDVKIEKMEIVKDYDFKK